MGLLRSTDLRPWISCLSAAIVFGACGTGPDVLLGGSRSGGGLGAGGEQAPSGGEGGQPGTGSRNGIGGRAAGGRASDGGTAGEGTAGDGPGSVVVTNIRPLRELNSEDVDDNPTLTEDELLLCFTSTRPTSSGGSDVWCATRDSLDAPFGTPEEQTSLNTDDFESSPVISSDGLSIWFGSDSGDGVDIFQAFRAERSLPWEPAVSVDELNSDEDDIPRPLALSGTVMPMSSRRDGSSYWTYLAERSDPSAAFAQPELIEELTETGRSVVDGFLTEDALTLLFTVTYAEDGTDPGDLYFATRADLASPFSAMEPLSGVNSEGDDRDPFLSRDERRLYFSSSRDGDRDIFVADVVLRR
jgi:WD40-like Beta Propeller Repeat